MFLSTHKGSTVMEESFRPRFDDMSFRDVSTFRAIIHENKTKQKNLCNQEHDLKYVKVCRKVTICATSRTIGELHLFFSVLVESKEEKRGFFFCTVGT